jgi:hypothetical protein
MNCHKIVKNDSDALTLVNDSWETNTPIEWIRIHKVPDYAYFNHSAHINVGVGCSSCHGRVDQMDVVHQVESLSMAWCLECHRDPSQHLRPLNKVTDMTWIADENQAEIGKQLIKDRNITPPEDCTGCHR